MMQDRRRSYGLISRPPEGPLHSVRNREGHVLFGLVSHKAWRPGVRARSPIPSRAMLRLPNVLFRSYAALTFERDRREFRPLRRRKAVAI